MPHLKAFRCLIHFVHINFLKHIVSSATEKLRYPNSRDDTTRLSQRVSKHLSPNPPAMVLSVQTSYVCSYYTTTIQPDKDQSKQYFGGLMTFEKNITKKYYRWTFNLRKPVKRGADRVCFHKCLKKMFVHHYQSFHFYHSFFLQIHKTLSLVYNSIKILIRSLISKSKWSRLFIQKQKQLLMNFVLSNLTLNLQC